MSGDYAPLVRRSLSDQIARRLTDSIAAGEFHAGDRLPSIAEMARLFRVAKPTVREALRSIAAMGVVEMKHGVGTYVLARPGGNPFRETRVSPLYSK